MEDSGGLALRGLATVLFQDDCLDEPQGKDGQASLVHFIVRKQRRVVRSTFSDEFNGLVDSMESLLLLQVILHQVYCGTAGSPHQLVDKLEAGKLHPPLDLGVDATPAFHAVEAADVCDPAGSSLKLHFISVRDRMSQGMIRYLYWVDTRDMLADGFTKGAVDRALLENNSQMCKYECVNEPERHSKVKQEEG